MEQELSKLTIGTPALTFSNIARHGNGCSAHLLAEAVKLVLGKP